MGPKRKPATQEKRQEKFTKRRKAAAERDALVRAQGATPKAAAMASDPEPEAEGTPRQEARAGDASTGDAEQPAVLEAAPATSPLDAARSALIQRGRTCTVAALAADSIV